MNVTQNQVRDSSAEPIQADSKDDFFLTDKITQAYLLLMLCINAFFIGTQFVLPWMIVTFIVIPTALIIHVIIKSTNSVILLMLFSFIVGCIDTFIYLYILSKRVPTAGAMDTHIIDHRIMPTAYVIIMIFFTGISIISYKIKDYKTFAFLSILYFGLVSPIYCCILYSVFGYGALDTIKLCTILLVFFGYIITDTYYLMKTSEHTVILAERLFFDFFIFF